jgi:hypothetical protein
MNNADTDERLLAVPTSLMDVSISISLLGFRRWGEN